MNAIPVKSMNITPIYLATMFTAQYGTYRAIRDTRYSWSQFSGNIDTLFPSLARCNFNVGTIQTGEVGVGEDKCEYILAQTKVGAIMVYQKNDLSVHYFCEESFAMCESAKANGFGETAGSITTLDQIEHILSVIDSYA